ncbi:apelin receptor B-like [Engraulis encrasicolus]|uniref:apelin receptor B-like n=1 Tax=Engraulis encrasicolus TaxID=184585 RepID=UPI002FD28BB0
MEHLNHSRSNGSGISTMHQASTGVLGACFLLGVPANIAVLVFLRRHLKKDNFTLHLMLNLAASDILRLITLPLWMYNLNFAWTLGRALCKLASLLIFTSTNCSVLTVTLMSIQRYVVVLHRSQWTKLGSKGEKLLLVCLWSLALILSSPAAVKADITEGQNSVCQRVTDEETLGILLGETLLGFVLPFSIMAMFYFCLHKKVKQNPLFSNPRLARLVIAILVTFFILWFPFHVMNLTFPNPRRVKGKRYDKFNNRS